ncbi:DUF559 domain-containing protein [Chitinophaga sp. YIM B06452]|uniref:DUF559 domain-containing protein n=1 Tax=Chitinophaga sp. YIM B06452 TaxID=3082158 RepID=UPI0031FF2969
MKKARFTVPQLEKTACARLNKPLIEELKGEKPKKSSTVPREDCKQVRWMWGQLVWWAHLENIEVTREHRFHPVRKWRFDFAVPAYKIGVEYEGLNSEKSGHTTLVGYTKDTEKYNAAQELGWRVIRFTAKNYRKVLTELNKLIKK